MDKANAYRQLIGQQAMQMADLQVNLAAQQAEANEKIVLLESELERAKAHLAELEAQSKPRDSEEAA